MVHGELHLEVADAVGQRHADAKVRGPHVPIVVQAQLREGGPFDVELPSLGAKAVGRAVTQNAHPSAGLGTPQPAEPFLIVEDAGHARLFDAGQIGMPDQALGKQLPAPGRVVGQGLGQRVIDRCGLRRRTVGDHGPFGNRLGFNYRDRRACGRLHGGPGSAGALRAPRRESARAPSTDSRTTWPTFEITAHSDFDFAQPSAGLHDRRRRR